MDRNTIRIFSFCGYGKVVKVINSYVENGVKKTAETLYAHMSEILVREGQKIDIGTQLS